ncbi:hypothetical protein SAMN03080615_00550 [Amphritea atlantica]|uniref:Uncharacterized protein n=1 Tax=Amphritea atlantica TaxID=355243 RepID=A0A1H9DHM3_9GAMM|nr:hypothetical protein [Amphritea atlantica]SEQ12807.1 hypothetical protein SAMN03080615_00550 [Amphritea atlantica]
MEHLTIYFKHGLRDIIPYHNYIKLAKEEIVRAGLGEYLGDDMAIDGGDAEAVFSCENSIELFEYLKTGLVALPFMRGAKITLTFGELETKAPEKVFYI